MTVEWFLGGGMTLALLLAQVADWWLTLGRQDLTGRRNEEDTKK